MKRNLFVAGAAALSLAALAVGASPSQASNEMSAMTDKPSVPTHYPETRRMDLVEERFGVEVADPYRWLENDVREDRQVAEWVAAQNKVTTSYLGSLPGRDVFARALRELIDFERFSSPQEESGRYAYTYNSGLMNQDVLMVREGAAGEGRVVIDPNRWSGDDTVALAEWDMSPNGRYIAFAQQDGGSDWRTLKILDLETGEVLADTIEWVKFSGLDWDGDSEGIFYSRYPRPGEGEEFQSLNLNQRLFYHRLGTEQSEDRLVYETSDEPKLGHTAMVTDDGRYLVITSVEGTESRDDVHVIDLKDPEWKPRALVLGRENAWKPFGSSGEDIYFRTNLDAPRERIVKLDASRELPEPVQIVAEDEAVLEDAVLKDGMIAASYLADVKSDLRLFTAEGAPRGRIDLPGLGTSYVSSGGDGEIFYSFTSFTQPASIYRYEIEEDESSEWAAPDLPFDPRNFTAEQVFYTSKDGTRVPMFIVRRSDLDMSKSHPTLLYGYGGFNVSVLPGYSATRMAWIEQGGVYAVANIRGGGEYGKAWHDAGRLENKQNVFDDFIAAGEYLVSEGVTTPEKLAILGGSNGGLLVGAVVNQRPDLFGAAVPVVGVMDMVRFDQFTAGRYWVDDYGHPDREADFRTLYAYSPYHNIRSGTDYPPILVTTADTDDRVVPGHSFKYTAALQAADLGDAPHLIRIETRAGHGSGKPVDKIIEEYADVWAFVAANTGLEVAND